MSGDKDVQGKRQASFVSYVPEESMKERGESGRFSGHTVKEQDALLSAELRIRDTGKKDKGIGQWFISLFKKEESVRYQQLPEAEEEAVSSHTRKHPADGNQEPLRDIDDSLESFKRHVLAFKQRGAVEHNGQAELFLKDLEEIRMAISTLEGCPRRKQREADYLEATASELESRWKSTKDHQSLAIELDSIAVRVESHVKKLVDFIKKNDDPWAAAMPAFGGVDQAQRAYLKKPVYFDPQSRQLKVDDKSFVKRVVAKVCPRVYANKTFKDALGQLFDKSVVDQAYKIYFGEKYSHWKVKVTDRDVAVLLKAIKKLQAPPVEPGVAEVRTMTDQDQVVFRFDKKQGGIMTLTDSEVVRLYEQELQDSDDEPSEHRVDLLDATINPKWLMAIRRSLSFSSFKQSLNDYLMSINGGNEYYAEEFVDEALILYLGSTEYKGLFTSEMASDILQLLDKKPVLNFAKERLKAYFPEGDKFDALPDKVKADFDSQDGLSSKIRAKEGAIPEIPAHCMEPGQYDEFKQKCLRELEKHTKEAQLEAKIKLQDKVKKGRRPSPADIANAKMGIILSDKDVEKIAVKVYAEQVAPQRMGALKAIMENRNEKDQ
ncbi:hypothetical protein [Endozoicomonas sp. Mp262]|uniref:hypothetical protein n=1 Tax=Endozoicomonas sp. Mp262 TaxID=2919499 RepID=UPI0021DB7EB1